jgi:aminoglycoside phosphotransferase (APT) family kinase protein
MAAIVSMAESFRGVLTDRDDVPRFEIVLDGPRTDTLARYDDRSRRLLAWIRTVAARRPATGGDDVVHCDYHRDNILFDTERKLTGIVDWHEGNLRRGDWRYHLINLAFDFAWALARDWNLIDLAAMQHLDSAIATIDPTLVDVFWAHQSLLTVNMLLTRHWYPDADTLIDFALRRVPE